MPTFAGEIILIILLFLLLSVLFIKLKKPKKTAELSNDKSIKQTYPTSNSDAAWMAFFMLTSLAIYVIIFFTEISLSPASIALSILIFIISGIGYLHFALLKHPEINAKAKVFSKSKAGDRNKDNNMRMTFLFASNEKMEFSVNKKTYNTFNVGDVVNIKYQGTFLLEINKA